jgi:hypothetical protein
MHGHGEGMMTNQAHRQVLLLLERRQLAAICAGMTFSGL